MAPVTKWALKRLNRWGRETIFLQIDTLRTERQAVRIVTRLYLFTILWATLKITNPQFLLHCTIRNLAFEFYINTVSVNVGVHVSYTGGLNLLINQFFAMLMKKFLSTYRSWLLLVIQILTPVLFLIIAMIIMKTAQDAGDLPALAMDLNRFDDPVTVVGNTSDMAYVERYLGVLKSLNYHAEMTNNVTKTMLDLVSPKIPHFCYSFYI